MSERKELFVTLTFSIGECPSAKELRESGITLLDYANEMLDGFELPGPFQDAEIEIKVSKRAVQE